MGETVVVFSADYGLTEDKAHLSAQAMDALERGIGYANRLSDVVFSYSAVNIPSQGMRGEAVGKWKERMVNKKLFLQIPTTTVLARNSVDEAVNTKAALAEKEIEPKKIIIFCERWHAIRLRIVWGKAFPGVDIEIHPAPRIGRDYVQRSMRSNTFTWAIVNLGGAVVTLALPLKWVANVRQPS